MAEDYIRYPVDVSPDTVAEEIVTHIRAAEDGWDPQPGGLDWLIIESFSHIAARVLADASEVREAAFRYAGLNLFQVPPIDAAHAMAITTWTVADSQGYTIPAGTIVSYRAPGGEPATFRTTQDHLVPAGETTVGGVQVTATEPGAAGNGLTGPELVDSIPFVTGITQAAATTGGEDGETDADYLARLPLEIEMQKTPVRERDAALVAARVPGVGRAVAVSGWDTITDATGQEKTLGLVVVDPTGQNCTSDVKDAVKAALEQLREVNFIFGVADPTRTTVDVAATVKGKEGYTPVDVEAGVQAALARWLDPTGWGAEFFAHVGPTGWDNTTTVRLFEAAAVLDRADGVDYVTAVTLNGAAADVTLTGRVPLPTLGAVTITVT